MYVRERASVCVRVFVCDFIFCLFNFEIVSNFTQRLLFSHLRRNVLEKQKKRERVKVNKRGENDDGRINLKEEQKKKKRNEERWTFKQTLLTNQAGDERPV